MQTKPSKSDGVIIPVKFRWPVQQLNDFAVEVMVPTGGEALLRLNEGVTQRLSLSDRELDEMVEAAHEAAIRSIMIVR